MLVKLRKIWLFVIAFLLPVKMSFALSPADFAPYFEVDLDAPLPDVAAVAEEYAERTSIYNPRYILSWDMGTAFEPYWVKTITDYGKTERRLKNRNEDALLDLIKSLPPEFYPYIGPMLHNTQGISEKILNMPGIKETKNKFPQRIAPQLADIEDLSFLSPHMYLLLMPELWPQNNQTLEIPQRYRAKKQPLNQPPLLNKDILALVPEQGFGGAARQDSPPDMRDLRTLKITKTSPLTSADIKAFLRTLDGVEKFGSLSNLVKLNRAGILLNYWEQQNGTALAINGLKDSVNPCQRMVLRAKWAGLQNEFSAVVAPQGFSLNEWAYTCDKTIKAYRLSRVSASMLISLRQFKQGRYDSYFSLLKQPYRENQYAVIQSLMEMHKAPKQDVLRALENETQIKKALLPLHGKLLVMPLN